MALKLATICSGIGAPETAALGLDVEPVWCAEIEAFPSAVLEARHGGAINLGDMTAADFVERAVSIGIPDILVAGTPCQAFSVAGLRGGLTDSRGNLTLRLVEILDGLCDAARPAGLPEPVLLWENVPGVLSDKTNAFGCFLGGLCGSDAAIVPPGGKWTSAGVVAGPRRLAVWRTLDAQYFGLAQRRRRVFVVASAGERACPPEILFEFTGLRRDLAPRREAGKAVAGTLAARTRGGGGLGTDFEAGGGGLIPESARGYRMTAFGEYEDDDTASTLKQRDYKDATDLVAHTLRGEDGAGLPDVVGALQSSHTPRGHGMAGVNSQAVAQGHIIPCAIPLQEVGKRTGVSTDDPRAGIGIGQEGDPMFTLQAGAQHGVACGNPDVDALMAGRGEGFDASEDGTGRGVPLVPECFGIDEEQNATTELMGCLKARTKGGGFEAAIAFTCKDHGQDAGEVAPTLRSMGHDASHANGGGQVEVAFSFDWQKGNDKNNVRPSTMNPVEDGTNTLGSSRVPAVAFYPTGGTHGVSALEDCSPAVKVGSGLGIPSPPAVAFCERGLEQGRTLETQEDVAYCLTNPGSGGRTHSRQVMTPAMQVRRLLPVECERLQGFPDGHTDIVHRGKPAADGPRYKALGNSMAVPVIRWILSRIETSLKQAESTHE